MQQQLTEDEVRRKVVWLLNLMDLARMDAWVISATFSGVLDGELYERVMREEIEKVAPHVREWWLGEPCTCQHPGATALGQSLN
jgi:hypothetical protein